jgi:hypothetical protein
MLEQSSGPVKVRLPRAQWLLEEGRRVQHLEREIATRMGFSEFTAYLRDRLGRGWSYDRIARESGRNRDWVRRAAKRHAGD